MDQIGSFLVYDEAAYKETLRSERAESVRRSMKETFKSEVEEEERTRKCCASCKTVTQYLLSELTKKPSACKIGVFTVFLVVMVITMLKSVVDSAPVLFVKLGQDNVGAIDFTLKASYNSFLEIPVNYYNINPFGGRFYSPD